MNLKDVIDPSLLSQLEERTVIGVDIGSRGAKAVLLHKGELHVAQIATGVNMQDSANELLEDLLEKADLPRSSVEHLVGTGYGRVALQFSDIPSEIVTEISCHALGAHFLNATTRTIIDIGGQDSKVIQVDPATGKVLRFIMNDKCAAGTGRFLEKAAEILEYSIADIGPASLKADKPADLSSQCVVFAESEIISHRARGETRENIAAGLHLSTARRVRNILSRIPLEADLVFTGGVSNNVGMKHALETLVGHPIVTPRLDMIYAGALGAAIHSAKASRRAVTVSTGSGIPQADLSDVVDRLAERRKEFPGLTEPKVGFLCNYVPLELINASGAAYARLSEAGEAETVSQGELITKAVFCDLTKSILGHFETKDPVYESLDQVVTFFTCDCMRATGEAIDNFFKPTNIYVVPRSGDRPEGRAFFRGEILNFRKDLEALTGRAISDDDAIAQIKLYNRIRKGVRRISALRQRNNPPLSGRDFLEITSAATRLPPEELVLLLDDLHQRLAKTPDDDRPRLRLMMAGGIVAEGDRRIIDLVEKEIGASIVVEDHCTGVSPFYHETDERKDPWTALAEAYLDKAPCARQFPIDRRVDFSAQLAQDYRVDGVIYTYLKFCPCYGMTKAAFFAKFQELGIPVLELGSDYSLGDTGQIKTRIEAFVEVLREKLQVAA